MITERALTAAAILRPRHVCEISARDCSNCMMGAEIYAPRGSDDRIWFAWLADTYGEISRSMIGRPGYGTRPYTPPLTGDPS